MPDSRIAIAFLFACAGASCDSLPAAQAEVGMYRGDASHTGVYAGAGVPHYGGVLWRFATNGPVRSSPLAAGDAVYVGSSDGFVYALDAATGAQKWAFDTKSAVSASPAIAGNLILIGARDGTFFGIDRSSGAEAWRFKTGDLAALAWGFESGDNWTSSVTVGNGEAYFGAGDGRVYAVDATNGAEKWHYQTEGRVRSTPAVANGVVYAGSMDGTMYALDAATGALRWRFDTEGHGLNSGDFGFDRRTIQSSPAVVNGTVFFGSRDGFVYAIDATTGKQKWRFDHEQSWSISSPAVADGTVNTGSSDAHFFQAIDASTGRERWRFPTERSVWSSPAVAGDVVYVGEGGGALHALDRRTGVELWSYSAGGTVFTSPSVRDSVLYFGADDGIVYALHASPRDNLARAVFWDSTYERRAFNGRGPALRDNLAARGFSVVDAGGAADFMRARIADRSPGVLVFALDYLPDPLGASGDGGQALLRRYLDAGGKVVWVGTPPAIWPKTPDGETSYAKIDRAGTAKLLGVDQARANFDRLGSRVTDDGRRWGLTGWFMGDWAVDPAAVSAVLATDEDGNASSWVKTYANGGAFVKLGSGIADFEAVRAVAEHYGGR
jgi:outer membrane protein assembly factor BamB